MAEDSDWCTGDTQPIEFLDTFAGIEAVKADLMRLKHGVVS